MLRDRPADTFQRILGSAQVLVILIVLYQLLRRSRTVAAEARGWHLLMATMVIGLLTNAYMVATIHQQQAFPWWVFLIINLGIAAIFGLALHRWPWSRPLAHRSATSSVLGSIMFGGSVFLLLWIFGIWEEGFRSQSATHLRLLALAARLSITGGLVAYLASENPRRLKGPLGWVLASIGFQAATVVLLQNYVQATTTVPSPAFVVALGVPICLGLAAQSPNPVEPDSGRPVLALPIGDILINAPVPILAILLAWLSSVNGSALAGPLVGFMVIVMLLLARQFLLLREIRHSHHRLEDRVLQRTRSLEELQTTLLRNERMNSVALLGAGLAHDLNNLLGAIVGVAEVIKLRLQGGQPVALGDVDKVLLASRQSSALTGKLMTFARDEPNPVHLLDLHQTIHDLAPVLRMLVSRRVNLAFEFLSREFWVLGTQERLEQILLNLISNANDAMPQGGHIVLTTRLAEGAAPVEVILSVRDTGSGMGPDVVAEIFKPFYTTKPKGKGTGLGLASVRYLMEEVGGQVRVHSVPGEGTTFELAFPLVTDLAEVDELPAGTQAAGIPDNPLARTERRSR